MEHRRGRDRIVLPDDRVELSLSRERNRLKLAKREKINHYDGPPADQLLARYFPNFECYTCQAQHDVVHALVAPEGPKNIVARLPTGGGKSLLYVLPCAVWRANGGPSTALVVSPIVALQNDQVDKITTKYKSLGLVARQINSTVDADEKTETYRMFRRGELDVLFVSPERVTDPIFREIVALAAEHIRLLVIDEAHIVDEWGQDFRPDFFRLGRERERLLERAPQLRTLFLSATITKDTETTLEKVFKLQPPAVQFTDPDLRTEVSIRVIGCSNEEKRTTALHQLLDEVPFPCIVYCSKVDHVRALKRDLKARGLLRQTDYMGPTPMKARRERLRWFHDRDVDVVVATSAFGLGVDKADVRTIIHFDVPSSLDAYYQAIGRAARDGWTGHAFLLYSAGSMSAATRENLAILRSEKARDRAEQMISNADKLKWDGPGASLVPLHVRPEHIEKMSALNRTWNAVVLNILDEIGALHIDGLVHRHVPVRRGKNREALREDACSPIRDALKKSETMLDLVAVSRKHKIAVAELSRMLTHLVLVRALEFGERQDDGEAEEWVLIHRESDSAWSAESIEAELDAHRDQRMRRAARETREFRRFLKSPGCRFAPIAEVYEFQLEKPCGHCDRCDPTLAF
jgi:ATP-dependent DNA helicase RecQ